MRIANVCMCVCEPDIPRRTGVRRKHTHKHCGVYTTIYKEVYKLYCKKYMRSCFGMQCGAARRRRARRIERKGGQSKGQTRTMRVCVHLNIRIFSAVSARSLIVRTVDGSHAKALPEHWIMIGICLDYKQKRKTCQAYEESIGDGKP